MAVYTIELGALLKSGYDIGLEDYPVPKFVPYEQAAAWRHALNQKIVDHYLYNEICCVPPDRFKHFLNMTMREQMPYYNKLYEALNQRWNFTTGSTLTEIISDTSTDNKVTTDDGRDNRIINYGQVDQTVVDTDTTHTNTITDDGGHTLDSTKNVVGTKTHDEETTGTKDSNEGVIQGTDSNKDTLGTEDATTDTTGKKVIDTDTTNSSTEGKTTTFTGEVVTIASGTDIISDTPGSPITLTSSLAEGYASNAKHSTNNSSETTINSETVSDTINGSGTVDTTEDTTGKEVLDRDTTGNEKYTEDVIKDTIYGEKTTGTDDYQERTTEDTTYSEQGKTWNQNDDNGSTTLDTTTDYKSNQETKNYGTDYNRKDEKADSSYNRSRMQTGLSNMAYIDLFDKYARLMRNIDLEVIAALSSCFMGIF